jgi:hypothetical protein
MKNQPKKTFTYDGLFIVAVSIKKGKPIEQLMNDKEKQVTGLAKLSYEELANLNEWLDTNSVLAPGDPPHYEYTPRN